MDLSKQHPSDGSRQHQHREPLHYPEPVSRLTPAEKTPQHCKMSDVVTLPFPLTWLWRSGKTAEDILGTIDSMNNGIRAEAQAEGIGLASVNKNDDTSGLDCVSTTTTPVPQTEHRITTTSNATPTTGTRKNITPAARTPKISTPVTASTKVMPLSDEQIEDYEFKDGTAEIPAEINELSIRIHACKHHANIRLPVRQDLKKQFPEHFFSSSTHLRPISPLYKWVGDTRLFSREEWLYLIGTANAYERRRRKGGE